MPPKQPLSPEGGERFIGYADDIRRLVRTCGMTEAEAHEVIHLPVVMMNRLRDYEPQEEVLRSALDRIEQYEATYPPDSLWDDQRIALAQAFIGIGNIPAGMRLLVGVRDITYMMDHISDFLIQRAYAGALPPEELPEIALAIRAAFENEGRGKEFVGLTVESLLSISRSAVPVWQARERKPTTEQERYARASWDDIAVVVDQETVWPEGATEDARRSFGSQFAQLQHAMLAGPKVERKAVEALKALLKEQGQEAEVWDRFRLIAAMSLYDAGASNFGRGMARAMTDPEMVGMVCHALIDTDRAREAMLVAQEISDPRVYGKILYLGDWPADMQVPALIEDLTQATVQNNKKYAPGLRIGVAEGLLELFERNRQETEAAGEPATAAHWATQVEAMQKRLALLQSQQKSGFIKPPSARKK
jgi:hypothetical protein